MLTVPALPLLLPLLLLLLLLLLAVVLVATGVAILPAPAAEAALRPCAQAVNTLVRCATGCPSADARDPDGSADNGCWVGCCGGSWGCMEGEIVAVWRATCAACAAVDEGACAERGSGLLA